MDTIYLIKYTAQENSAYVAGVLAAYRSLRAATEAFAEELTNLSSPAWKRTDSGMSPETIRETKAKTRELQLYHASFYNESSSRLLQLYIESLNVN